jgi:hypothetical protein
VDAAGGGVEMGEAVEVVIQHDLTMGALAELALQNEEASSHVRPCERRLAQELFGTGQNAGMHHPAQTARHKTGFFNGFLSLQRKSRANMTTKRSMPAMAEAKASPIAPDMFSDQAFRLRAMGQESADGFTKHILDLVIERRHDVLLVHRVWLTAPGT